MASRRSDRLWASELHQRQLAPLGLTSLPHEVTLQVLSSLPPPDLCAVECTCRHFAVRASYDKSCDAAAAGATVVRLLTLPERAAQCRMLPALPLRDESYKELLAWGAPLKSWDASKRHRQLEMPSPELGGENIDGLHCGPVLAHVHPQDDDSDAEGEDDNPESPEVAAVRNRTEQLARAFTRLASIVFVPVATCRSEAPPGEGIFPAAVTHPFSGGTQRVRIRLSGDAACVAPCAVGICPADFPAAVRSCPSQWYDLCK